MALLIFGPKKLPQLGKTFGKSMAEFRRASNDLRNTFQCEMDTIEKESEDVKEVAEEVKKDLDTSTYYDDSEDDYYSDYDQTPYEDKSSKTTSATPQPARTPTPPRPPPTAMMQGHPPPPMTGHLQTRLLPQSTRVRKPRK